MVSKNEVRKWIVFSIEAIFAEANVELVRDEMYSEILLGERSDRFSLALFVYSWRIDAFCFSKGKSK